MVTNRDSTNLSVCNDKIVESAECTFVKFHEFTEKIKTALKDLLRFRFRIQNVLQ